MRTRELKKDAGRSSGSSTKLNRPVSQTLSKLYRTHRGKVTDKWNFYLGAYGKWFEQIRNKRVSILEIGIQNGGSLEIWLKYFRNAEFIVGCDINTSCAELTFSSKKISVIVGDANNDQVERRISDTCPNYDIIIDDGSHKSSDIVRSFSRYFKNLKLDGFYIIEDLHCSYWDEFEGALASPYSAMAFLKQLADIVNFEYWGLNTNRLDLIRPILDQYRCSIDDLQLKQIQSIEFKNSLCLIRKVKTIENHAQRIVVGDEQTIFPIRHLSGTSLAIPRQASNRWNSYGLSPDVQFFQLRQDVDILKMTISRLSSMRSALEEEFSRLSRELLVVLEKNQQMERNLLLVGGKANRRFGVKLPLHKLLNRAAKVFQHIKLNILVGEFDPTFYLKCYPDVAESGIEPYKHYIEYGKKEGRLRRLSLSNSKGEQSFDNNRETLLIAVHESSFTGAPILGQNLVRLLSQKYNIIAVSLRGGPLDKSFLEYSHEYIIPVEGPIASLQEDVLATGLLSPLMQRFKIKALLANSAEAEALVSAASISQLPAVTLVHEFAEYTAPARMSRLARNSDILVFSSRMTLESAKRLNLGKFDQHTFIVAQGRSEVTPSNSNGIRSTYLKQLLSRNGQIQFICIGCGSVQIRKGVDLFIAAAAIVAKALGPETVQFIWIGDGYEPESDFAYSVWLKDQVSRSGVENVMAFVPSVGSQDLEMAYQGADCLFLSSRLDPFPNVGIDAICEELPVVCFSGASGIAQYLEDGEICKGLVAPYLDVASAAEIIIRLARNANFSQQIALALQTISKNFDMNSYVEKLDKFIDLSVDICERRREDALLIAGEGILDRNLLRLPLKGAYTDFDMALKYVRTTEGDAYGAQRRPVLGFSPQVYGEKYLSNQNLPRQNALAHWLKSGRPIGPWLRKLLTIAGRHDIDAAKTFLKVAIHVHVHYSDVAKEILAKIMSNVSRPQLLVSVTSAELAKEMAELFSDYDGPSTEILLVENKGRDIAPFLCQFSDRLQQFDIIGHFHTKKSINSAKLKSGEVDEWREFLLDTLIGGKYNCMDQILSAMQSDERIGLVFPEDPNIVGWTKNRQHAESLVGRLKLGALSSGIEFPVGNMFFARSRALASMFDAKFQLNEFPDEPVDYDGTILHAIERITPLVIEAAGFEAHAVHCKDVLR
jgi:glycosyltransferase involved in cell wall biosynthesis